MTYMAANSADRHVSARLAATGLVIYAFVTLAAGTSLGELAVIPRILGTLAGGVILTAAVWRGAPHADTLDRSAMLAVLLFATAGILSALPRQAVDAVLGAAALVAGLYLARDILAVERYRRWFVRVMLVLSAVLTLVTAARWFPPLADSATATGSVIPRLALELPAVPWGHRYDLVLLLVVLYPAWWMGSARSRLRVTLGAMVGLLVLTAVIVSGSRTLWAAIGVASLVVVVPKLWTSLRSSRSAIVGSAFIGLVVTLGLVLSGAASAIAARLMNTESLDWRLALWQSVMDVFSERLVAGLGPGTFPWALQGSGYFDANSWPPRHPDSALIQLVAEAGVLGIVAGVVVVAAVASAVIRGRSRASQWVVAVAFLASLTANPTDFMFLNVAVLGWVAFGAPHQVMNPAGHPSASSVVRTLGLGAIALIATASLSWHVAAVASDRARESIAGGELAHASTALDFAARTDSGMALYWRHLGSAAYQMGQDGEAITHLERAAARNPKDPIAWRALSLALERAGETDRAMASAERAVHLQRSDPTNLLILARLEESRGSLTRATDLLAEAIQTWPYIVAAAGWEEQTSLPTDQLIDLALQRSLTGAPFPDRLSDQPLWLVAMANRPDLDDWAIRLTGIDPVIGQLSIELTRCDPTAIDRVEDLSPGHRLTAEYSVLQARADALTASLELGSAPTLRLPMAQLNPFNDNGPLPADAFGYRRPSIAWPGSADAVPSPQVGLERWLNFPVQATEIAGLTDQLVGCTVATR